MTIQHESVSELFGLAGTFPRPGWVVLDAARDQRVTGELVFDTVPAVRVYVDRGQIYLAERLTDPSFGARLVDAGALTAAQLERGAVRIGDIEHLGRLFERVPSLDRHTVIVTAELMTEECVGWLAAQRVPEVVWTPYRHHESGMHLWGRTPSTVELTPGAPLPAPPVGEGPVSFAPPSIGDRRPLAERTEPFLDGQIEWDEPCWLDGSLDAGRIDAGHLEAAETVAAPAGDDVVGATPAADAAPAADWVDRLAADGLPDDRDPLVSPARLPRLPVEPTERFELVWPSGEIDEEFGAVDSVVGNGHDPDADRVGATARLTRVGAAPAAEPSPPATVDALDAGPAETIDDDGDEVVLAVRRAVASIEVGSLAARQRLAVTNGSLGGRHLDDPTGVPAPGRVAVRSGRNDWSRRTVTRSVFDEPIAEPPLPVPDPVAPAEEHVDRRAGALRRLIASLRR